MASPIRRRSTKGWFDDAALTGIRPDPSQKLHADVFGADIARQKRASNPVCFWLVSEPHELTTQSHVGDSRKSGFRWGASAERPVRGRLRSRWRPSRRRSSSFLGGLARLCSRRRDRGSQKMVGRHCRRLPPRPVGNCLLGRRAICHWRAMVGNLPQRLIFGFLL